MIGINSLYILVNDLLRKDHAGWISSDEFNRLVNLSQEVLFEFYNDTRDEREANNVLEVFEKTAMLTASSAGFFALPNDYKDRIEAALVTVSCGEKLWAPIDYLRRQTEFRTLSSPIRKPTLKRPKYVIRSGVMEVFPEVKGGVKLRYYRKPAEAERGFNLNTTTFEEEYDAGSSTDLEWGEGQTDNFVDLLLYYKGLTLRETELIQWVQSAKQLNQLAGDD